MIGFVLTTVVLAMIYKLMLRVRVTRRNDLLGAVATAMLFKVGRYWTGLYIGKSGVASACGAAGSLVVVLVVVVLVWVWVWVWVYHSAQFFLLGAEFTWAYAQRFGSMKKPVQFVGNVSAAAAATPPTAAPSRQRPTKESAPRLQH